MSEETSALWGEEGTYEVNKASHHLTQKFLNLSSLFSSTHPYQTFSIYHTSPDPCVSGPETCCVMKWGELTWMIAVTRSQAPKEGEVLGREVPRGKFKGKAKAKARGIS